MKTIGVIPNLYKDPELKVTKGIIEILRRFDCTPVIPEFVARKYGDLRELGVDYESLYRDSEFVVVLGGDGTILEASHAAAKNDTPLLGINLGTLGFLTDVEISGAEAAIAKALEGDYKLEARMMLDVTLFYETGENKVYTALNDVCVARGGVAKVVNLEVYVNDEYLDTYRADGLLVTSSTGSTAYNLSAGGPILKADAKIMAVTPICPHTLYARSIVLDSDDVVTITSLDKFRDDLMVSIDGKTVHFLKEGEHVKITKSACITKLIKTSNSGFYDVLREKMVRNGG